MVDGDLRAPLPLIAVMEGAGMSIEKVSRLGMAKDLTAVAVVVVVVVVVVAVAEWGESPVDEGDMFEKFESSKSSQPRIRKSTEQS